MRLGRDAFNSGAFFEAHELWEPVWQNLEGRERAWVQGMIQIAVALHQLDLGRSDVALRMLVKARSKLEGCAASLDGIDLGRLRRDSADALASIRAGSRPDLRVGKTSE